MGEGVIAWFGRLFDWWDGRQEGHGLGKPTR